MLPRNLFCIAEKHSLIKSLNFPTFLTQFKAQLVVPSAQDCLNNLLNTLDMLRPNLLKWTGVLFPSLLALLSPPSVSLHKVNPPLLTVSPGLATKRLDRMPVFARLVQYRTWSFSRTPVYSHARPCDSGTLSREE